MNRPKTANLHCPSVPCHVVAGPSADDSAYLVLRFPCSGRWPQHRMSTSIRAHGTPSTCYLCWGSPHKLTGWSSSVPGQQKSWPQQKKIEQIKDSWISGGLSNSGGLDLNQDTISSISEMPVVDLMVAKACRQTHCSRFAGRKRTDEAMACSKTSIFFWCCRMCLKKKLKKSSNLATGKVKGNQGRLASRAFVEWHLGTPTSEFDAWHVWNWSAPLHQPVHAYKQQSRKMKRSCLPGFEYLFFTSSDTYLGMKGTKTRPWGYESYCPFQAYPPSCQTPETGNLCDPNWLGSWISWIVPLRDEGCQSFTIFTRSFSSYCSRSLYCTLSLGSFCSVSVICGQEHI